MGSDDQQLEHADARRRELRTFPTSPRTTRECDSRSIDAWRDVEAVELAGDAGGRHVLEQDQEVVVVVLHVETLRRAGRDTPAIAA